MNSILTINGGSSSLKCALFCTTQPQPQLLYSFKISNILNQPRMKVIGPNNRLLQQFQLDFAQLPQELRYQHSLKQVMDWLSEKGLETGIRGISHRVVHGGSEFIQPMPIDAEVLRQLRSYVALAPLHQPYNLMLIEACQRHFPQLPQIACFDTMFHAGQSPEACHFALPRQLTAEGIKRYGFHGLSYEYIQRQLEARYPADAHSKTIVAHLGAGASMCAINQGRSIATTMGFTAVDGLPMGSRSGALDPGVLLYLMRHHGMDADRLEQLIYKESGWLGVSGISSDMLELLNTEAPQAQEAISLFTYRAGREIGSLSAALQGLEQLVFTGGVGENSSQIRRQITQHCRWLGVEVDDAANDRGEALISTHASRVSVRVMASDEEAMLALHGQEVLTDMAD